MTFTCLSLCMLTIECIKMNLLYKILAVFEEDGGVTKICQILFSDVFDVM